MNINTYFPLLLVLCAEGITAQNLVPNPGFESYSSCPTGQSQIDKATPWVDPHGLTSDWYHVCATGGSGADVDVPANVHGNQLARTGSGYGGEWVYMSGFPCPPFPPGGESGREYMQVQLSSPLVGGITYCVEFYASLADQHAIGIAELGAHFGTAQLWDLQLDEYWNYPGPPLTAQVVNTSGVISDYNGWVRISGSFTAAGGEQYMTVGNFSSDATTTRSAIDCSKMLKSAYYYLDDFYVGTSCPLPVELTCFKAAADAHGWAKLEWTTASEKNLDHFSVQRSEDGALFGEVGRVTGYASSGSRHAFTDNESMTGTRYYRLGMVDYNGDRSYSEIVKVNVKVKEAFSIKKMIVSGGMLEIRFILPSEEESDYELLDATGRNVLSGSFGRLPAGEHSFSIPTAALPAGIYCVVLRTGRDAVSGRLLLY